MPSPLLIGVSARIHHPVGPARDLGGVYTKTLHYLEQSVAHWVISANVLVFMIPAIESEGLIKRGDMRLYHYSDALDGLVLQGGADVAPESYGSKAEHPDWAGDRVRDRYEIELFEAFVGRGKPVLGICRGCQLINVAFGGTLHQDIATALPQAQVHRDPGRYDEAFHRVRFLPNTRLARLYPGRSEATINTIHHQSVNKVGRGLDVEAYAVPDDIIEAIRWRGPSYVFGVQWHPEFMHGPAMTAEHLDGTPILAEFLEAARAQEAQDLKIQNPATGGVIATVTTDNAKAVHAKYDRARAAQPRWAARSMAKRLAAIHEFRAQVVARTDLLARTLSEEVGKPLRQSRNELSALTGRLDFFLAESARALRDERVFASAEPKLEERITHEPLGVIANISAWNYPYFVGSNVFVPALVAGNAVLYKPSEFATLTGLHIAEMMQASGVPEDVFIPVVGDGATGAALLRMPVDGVFFTGSYGTGAKIAASAGQRMIKAQLELGGKDPIYVTDDVDVKAAAVAVADGAFYNTGQSCCSVERIYVHESVHDDFVDAFLAEVKGFKLGDPLDEATYIGAITRKPQLAVLKRQVGDAVKKGAKLRLGGDVLRRKGNWFAPTVLTDVDHSMAVMRDESFGPIIGIQAVADDDAAIDLMNDSEYGLTAGVYVRNEKRGRRILSRVNAGTVYWNCCDRVSPRLPWSGVKHSGIGLTLSTYGIQTFTRPKAWHLRHAGG